MWLAALSLDPFWPRAAIQVIIEKKIIIFFSGIFFIGWFLRNTGSRSVTKYSIYGGDPDGYFSIDSASGNIRIANKLDHETKSQVLLNVQATSGEPPDYAHTQVTIHIEDG